MQFLATLKAFFVGFGKMMGFLKDRQLLNAGKDAERGKQTENALKDIKYVKKTKKDVANLTDDELDSELFGDRNTD